MTDILEHFRLDILAEVRCWWISSYIHVSFLH